MTMLLLEGLSARGLFSFILCPTLFFAQTSAAEIPAEKFDLSQWNITLPTDMDNDKMADIVSVEDLQGYSHPDFFYLDERDNLVFVAPNIGFVAPNIPVMRSELRQMLRGTDRRIAANDPKNNWSIAAHPESDAFGAIGGKLEATLKVDHVALRARRPDKANAYSVVIGQIHVGDYNPPIEGYSYGNEPLKIYFKKWPGHETGSLFWTYERNLPRDDPNRIDIAYPVWGNTWLNPMDPGTDGLALGQAFSYTLNVHGNVLYLTFESDEHQRVEYELDLASNLDVYGNVDSYDNKGGYTGDLMFFKAGAYNHCSTRDYEGFWYPACLGTGNWEEDKNNGDYVKVSFSRLVLSESEPHQIEKAE